MKVTNVEKKENSTVELTIQVEPDAFEAAVQKAYLKARKNIAVPGFRKGKAPRKIIEGMYGTAVFYEEAINDALANLPAVTCSGGFTKSASEQAVKSAIEALTIKDWSKSGSNITLQDMVTVSYPGEWITPPVVNSTHKYTFEVSIELDSDPNNELFKTEVTVEVTYTAAP